MTNHIMTKAIALNRICRGFFFFFLEMAAKIFSNEIGIFAVLVARDAEFFGFWRISLVLTFSSLTLREMLLHLFIVARLVF